MLSFCSAAEDWKTLERAWDNNRATINASIFEMQIRVIQENVLGNCSSPSSTRFSIPKHSKIFKHMLRKALYLKALNTVSLLKITSNGELLII